MQTKAKGLVPLWLGVMLAVAACAGRQPVVTISPAKGETIVDVKASDFKFVPNNIKAYEGDVLVFRVENISGSGHNFTVKDPQGRILQNLPLPAKETTTVRVTLSEAGRYEFYCDKPFHAAFGMKGQILVVQAE